MLPRELWILWMYWVHIAIVVKSGGYYDRPFKGYCSVTQGDALYPAIFNVLVDAII